MEIPHRFEVEGEYARRWQRLNSQHRRELNGLLGSPPDVSRVPESFWRKVEDDTRREQERMLLLLFMSSATMHAAAAGDNPRDNEALRRELTTRGQGYAQTTAATLARTHATTSRDMVLRDARGWEESLRQTGRVTKSRVESDLTTVFGPNRTASTVTSETTDARTAGGETAVVLTVGLSGDDLWITRPFLSQSGPCPICEPLHKTRRPVWSQQFPRGPKAHPRCVCIIQYAFELARR